ncbi:hypothetical protein [Agrococcus terreus]|uniref:Secreted protein n=1 Tax=Agrococcus terreus TaxID=574649 RepID=A0ABQ2KPI6_9MICO|nr:hypothetical protein [Agrococcus terreus]GGN88463.1 hypothetical protein GCM10010968_24110 [Agrococcus terreus]
MRMRATAAAIALVAALSTTACAQTVCPAIGYLHTLAVEVADDRVASIELCDTDGCSSSEAAASPDSTGAFAHAAPEPDGAGRWLAGGLLDAPERVTVRMLDESGALLGEAEVEPAWQRTGGSEQCGGPHAATIDVAP